MPTTLGRGESQGIALAETIKAELLITDDAGARAEALLRGIAVTGTLGVLRVARDRGLIEAVLPLLVELRRLGQWFSAELEAEIRREESERG